MRLVCPNCGAQYEVEDGVIPEGGRDVQCSACGHAWYQLPSEPSEPEEPELPAEDDAALHGAGENRTADDGENFVEEIVVEEVEEVIVQLAEGPDEETDAEKEPQEEAGEEPATAIPAVSDDVRAILKEEAERELQARASEHTAAPQSVETQPDLGLDTAQAGDEERRRLARERVARLRESEDTSLPEADFDAHVGAEAENQGAKARGAELLPDIEEINSTLDRHEPAARHDAEAPVSAGQPRRNGFGRGFALTLFVAVLLFSLYLLAPKLAESVPALKPALTAYVEAVNAARAWLDTSLRALNAKLEAMSGQ